jgi:hypothetical protein
LREQFFSLTYWPPPFKLNENVEQKEGTMINKKRVLSATLFGFFAGFLCFLGGKYGLKAEMNTVEIIMILLHRGLLGFVIGISALRLHWALHGILLGLIVGLPAFPLILDEGGFLAYSLMGLVWGFAIEFFTSVVFKAKSFHI